MRKAPQQARSRQMVERIVVAGREVLVRDGYDGFSTNRVAAAAGISPGSLYQYFPDKAAVLDVVIDRYMADVSERVVASLGDRISGSGTGMVRDVVDALLSALEVDAALLRVVAEELPLARNRARRTALERQVEDLAAAWLAIRGATAVAPATAAWVLVLAIESLAVRWVLDQPEIARADLMDRIVALVDGFVTLG